jgi:hypothetical protein
MDHLRHLKLLNYISGIKVLVKQHPVQVEISLLRCFESLHTGLFSPKYQTRHFAAKVAKKS